MIKKITKLSKVLIKEYFQNLYIFNSNTKRINKKSNVLWLSIIVTIIIGYLSYKVIGFLTKYGLEILFLKVYFPFIMNIFIFQTILICCNVFFFSKDLEYILPLPVKPIELLIAKFNNIMSIIYGMESLFLFVPLLIYGIMTVKSLSYYLMVPIIFFVFIIFWVVLISTIITIIMQLSKWIKNKDIFQIIIIFSLTFVMSLIEMYIITTIFNYNIINLDENGQIQNTESNISILNDKLDELNKYFVVTNSYIKILNNSNVGIELIKLLILNISVFFVFLFIGKKVYLKNILKNVEYLNKKKNLKKNKKNKYKKKKMGNAYIKFEFLKIVKNPTFLMQCIFQYIFIVGFMLIIINLLFPVVIESFKKQDIINEMGLNNFILQFICIMLGILQIIFTLGNLSSTAFSRDGKDAVVVKYIPVSLYKQFIWKNIPQIVLNTIAIVGMCMIAIKNITQISIKYYIIVSIMAMILNIINCFLMCIIDLKRFNLNWTTETAVLKDNGTKSYQYVTTIVVILILIYFTNIFMDVNINISLSSILGILIIILILIKMYIKKNINKLFKKIY